MANETTAAGLYNAGSGGIVTAVAYDLLIRDPLRLQLVHDQFATVQSTNLSHDGASVRFTFVADLTVSTTALADEVSDATQEALVESHQDVSMAEYGRVVAITRKARGQAWAAIDPVGAERVGFNAGATIDTLARNALSASGNQYGDVSGNVDMSSNMLRKGSNSLKKNAVQPFANGLYAAIIHPDQEYDLRVESDAAGWRYYQQNMLPAGGQAGSAAIQYGSVVGNYEGFMLTVTARTNTSGSGATTNYLSYVIGKDGLGKAYSRVPGFGEYPQMVVGVQTDNLRRVSKLGWYWLGGYGIVRTAAVGKLNTGSSLN